MNGKFGANDFAGHPRRMRLPIGPIAALLLALLLIAAQVWSESNAAATYRAMELAKDEARKLKLPPQYEAKKKTKQKECVSRGSASALPHHLVSRA